MTREKRLEKLDHLRNLALSNNDTRAILKEKTEAIDKLTHNRPSNPNILKPTPKPEGDFELPKKGKGDKGFKDTYEEGIKNTRDDYDQKIYDSIEKNFENQGYDEYLMELKELDKKEVSILVGSNDGANRLLDYQDEKQKQQELEKDVDFRIDEKEEKEFHQEQEVVPSIEEESQINKDSNLDFRMDDMETDKFHETIENRPPDFEDKSKEVDKGKLEKETSDFQKNSRDVSDDFE